MKVLVLSIALAAVAAITIGATRPSAEGRLVSANSTGTPQTAPRVAKRERCRSARLAVVYYRSSTWSHQRVRGQVADRTPTVSGRSCRWARFAADEWQARARSARLTTKRWIAEHTLDDVASWPVAVRIVQRFFPGTESWMLDCSDAEGYNRGDPTRWVTFGGDPFSMAAWYADEVGGPPQYRPSTFSGHYRHGLDFITQLDYRVPSHLRDSGTTTAWRSMLAQAIAMGWARYTGNDNSHWKASWGNGC